MEVNKLSIMAGTPIPLPSLGLLLNQPKIKEIAAMGEDNYFVILSLFERADKTKFKEEIIEEEFKDKKDATPDDKRELSFELDIEFPTDYAVFLYLINSIPNLKINFESFLFLVFLNIIKIEVFKKEIIMYDKDNKQYIINNSSFEEFRVVVLSALNYKTEEEKSQEFNPVNEFANEIAKKIDAAKKMRAKQNRNVNKIESPISDMSSMLAASNNISILEIMNFTYPQLLIQYERSALLLNFTNQIRVSAFGGLKSEDIVDWTISL